MPTKVLKFGGSSLADASQFRKVAAIIKNRPDGRYVVASAPGKRFPEDIKVTDMLYHCAELAAKGEDITEAFSNIEARYNDIIAGLELDFSLDADFKEIREAIQNHAGADYVASRGEYLNSKVLAAYLGVAFVDAAEGIFFQEDGRLDEVRTNETLGNLLKHVDAAVIPGFYGTMPDGTVHTFSRGGSDITGSIVARAVNADIYENWTDVSGMLMADPRIVSNPRVISEITYQELRELSYMGATVMHEEAIFPVRDAGIPINIRNTNAPNDPGTMIVPSTEQDPPDTVITGIAGKEGFSSITIEKGRMNSEVGFARKVFTALEENNVPFEHAPTGIDTMSIVVSTAAIAHCRDALVSSIYEDAHADTVTVEDGIAMLAVVGRGMVRAKGTAGRLIKAIADQDINIRMIDQGACETNIIVGISEADYHRALCAVYDEFVRS